MRRNRVPAGEPWWMPQSVRRGMSVLTVARVTVGSALWFSEFRLRAGDPNAGDGSMLRWLLPIAALFALSAPVRAEIAHIDGATLQGLIAKGVPVVDVRTPAEWNRTGVIEGSHLLTFFDAEGRYDVGAFMSKLAAIAAPDRPVAVICHSGRRSNAVSRLLDGRFGYRRVYNFRGGIAKWIAEGRSTLDRR